jgi:hypothetical protein
MILPFLEVLLIIFSVWGQNKSPKRGICGDASGKDLSVFAPFVSWYYNWSIQPPAVSNGELQEIEWVPMQWGAIKADQVTTIASKIPAGSTFLLGFNEPNFKSQSNLTPAQAAAMWPYVEEVATKKNLILVSPAVNWCGDCVAGVTSDPVDWIDKFIAACPNCHFDYIAVHNYNSYLAPLKSYIEKFRKYGKPLWLTEFASWDDPVDYAGVVKYMKEALPYLEKEPLIYRYSWFATRVNSNHNLDLLGNDGTLTELGRLYATLPYEGTPTEDVAPLVLLPGTLKVNLPAGQQYASVKITGTAYDPNNDPLTFEWKQISGPTQAEIAAGSTMEPTVSGLHIGAYVFQVKVSANGKSDSNRITVTVNSTNIAEHKPVTASSTQSGNDASKVNDGEMSTRWSSLDSDPQWIMIDLQSSYTLTGVQISWEAAFAKEFSIDVSSDGSAWKSVFSTTSGTGGTNDITCNATGRYIRMYSTKRSNQAQYWGNSIYEFEVYGAATTTIKSSQSADNHHNNVYLKTYDNQIILTFPEMTEPTRVTVFDCNGKTCYTKRIPKYQGNCVMDIRKFKPGLYIIKVGDSKKVFTKIDS